MMPPCNLTISFIKLSPNVIISLAVGGGMVLINVDDLILIKIAYDFGTVHKVSVSLSLSL